MLQRRFMDANLKSRGTYASQRGFVMQYLASGGEKGDLDELGGWETHVMVNRYAKANAGKRAITAHKKLSSEDQLNVREPFNNLTR